MCFTKISLTLFLVSILSTVFAQTFDWNGSISDDWGTEQNWSPLGIPGPGSTVRINSDAMPNTCVLDQDRSVAILIISAGGLDLNGFEITTSTRTTVTGGVLENGFVSAPSISNIANAIINGPITFTKTGATNNTFGGGNTFNGPVSFINNGSARIRLANANGDTFNGDVLFSNNSIAVLDVAYNGENFFNGNVTVDNTGIGGVRIGQRNLVTSTSTIADGFALLSNGFSNGPLTIRRMTQLGNAVNGSFNPTIGLMHLCNFGGGLDVQSSTTSLTLNTSIFNGNNVFSGFTQLVLSGANSFNAVSGSSTLSVSASGTNTTWTGGNTFGPVSIINNGNNLLRLASSIGDTFNGPSTFVINGSGTLQIAYNGNSSFDGDITLNNNGTGAMSFGLSAGTSEQLSGALLTEGFTGGQLVINRFVQNGTSPNDPFTPTTFSANNSVINGNFSVTTTVSTIVLNSCQFTASNEFNAATTIAVNNSNHFSTVSGSTSFSIGGGGNVNWAGGNHFGPLSISHNSTGYLRLGNTTTDSFYGPATFTQVGNGSLSPAYNSNTLFFDEISTAGTAQPITFCSGTNGRVTIAGNAAQILSGDDTQIPTIRRLTMDCAPGGSLNLAVPLNISLDFNLQSGNINTTAQNILTLTDESTASNIGSPNSYVNGPMQITMNTNSTIRQTLNFGIGKDGDWRPAVLQVAHNATTPYTYRAEVFNESAWDFGWTRPSTVRKISDIHYWDITRYLSSTMDEAPSANIRTAAGQFPLMTLYFGENDIVYDGADLVICKNTEAEPTSWLDIGGIGAPDYDEGNLLSGQVTSTSNEFTSFSIFTLGSFSENPLPVTLVSFDAAVEQQQVMLSWQTASELNSMEFVVERSGDGAKFEAIDRVSAAGYSTELLRYQVLDPQPLSGKSYYRLLQRDIDGSVEYSDIKAVNLLPEAPAFSFTLYPNPCTDLVFIAPAAQASEMLGGSEVRVYHSTGKLVAQQVLELSGSTVLYTADLRPGLYLVEIGKGAQTQRFKLMRQ